jgi:hypothetical protein
VSRFLEDMIGDLNRQLSGDREEILDRAAAKIDASFSAHPETEGRLRVAVAKLYLDVDRPADAEPHLRKALAIMQAHRGFASADRVRAEDLLSRAAAAAASRRSK